MVIPFFRSKFNRLKKLIENGQLIEAKKLVEDDLSLIDALLELANSKNPKISSNSLYLLTKLFLKHNMDLKKIIVYIKKCLRSDNEDLVLHTLISLKLLLNEAPEYFKYVEDEIYTINKKFVNVLIREHTWELINNYGDIEKAIEGEVQKNKFYEKILKLKNSLKQGTLIKKLLDSGISLINTKLIERLSISKENIESSIKKDDLKGTLKLIKKGNVDKLCPLNVAYCFSMITNLSKSEIEEHIDGIFKLIFNKDEIIQNTALHTIYEISRDHPDLVYNRIDILRKYYKEYGRNSLIDQILNELSKKYTTNIKI